MNTEGTVLINRPIDEVFGLTLENVERWSEIVTEDYVVEDRNNGGVGTTFHTVTEDRGQRMEFEGEVLQHDPPNLHVIKMTGDMFAMEVAYSFDRESGNQTRVTQFTKVHGKGVFRVMLTLFGWMMRKRSCDAVQKELNNLKRFCEQGEPVEGQAT